MDYEGPRMESVDGSGRIYGISRLLLIFFSRTLVHFQSIEEETNSKHGSQVLDFCLTGGTIETYLQI